MKYIGPKKGLASSMAGKLKSPRMRRNWVKLASVTV